MGEGPVVVCLLSRLGIEPVALSHRVLEIPPQTPDDRWYGLGTGAPRPDVMATLAARARGGELLDAPGFATIAEHAEHERGEANDFVTEATVARCAVHLIVSLADVASGGDRAAVALGAVEELVGRDLPFFVHAIVDGSDSAVLDAVPMLAARLGERGALATIAGGDLAFGEDVRARGLAEVFAAIVIGHEGEQVPDAAEAIGSFLRGGGGAPSMPAVRVGGYRGARGSLEAEFGAAAPVWTWRSEDVVLVAVSQPRRLFGLVSLLIGSELPEEVAQRISFRGRPVRAFHPARVAATAPIGSLPVLPAVETTANASLVQIAASRGKRCATISDPRCAVLGTFTFDGDRALPEGLAVDRRVDDAPVEAAIELLGAASSPDLLVVTAEAPSSSASLAALFEAVDRQRGAFVVVALEPSVAVIAGLDPSLSEGGEGTPSARLFAAARARLGLGAP